MSDLMLFGIPHTTRLCPSCETQIDILRRETLMPVPKGALAPRSIHRHLGAICFDCAAAETLVRLKMAPDWDMARVAVANDRQEKLRLPGVPYGLPYTKVALGGDLERLQEWQDEVLPEEEF